MTNTSNEERSKEITSKYPVMLVLSLLQVENLISILDSHYKRRIKKLEDKGRERKRSEIDELSDIQQILQQVMICKNIATNKINASVINSAGLSPFYGAEEPKTSES